MPRHPARRFLFVLPLLLGACAAQPPVAHRPAQVQPAVVADTRAVRTPDRAWPNVFAAVQEAQLFEDQKFFVDAVPRSDPATVEAAYARDHVAPGFDLGAFVERHFVLPAAAAGTDIPRRDSLRAHIDALWPLLTRRSPEPLPHDSLLPLPQPYVVPGGRFREVYYWDSYFTMLGLLTDGRSDLVRSMLDNFAYLVRTVGHIPNGNRTYYLSRSQPPFFAAMVGRYAEATDTAEALRWLDALIAEHAFWMDGSERLPRGTAYRRVVRLPNGGLLNRYWDDDPTPRPESYREDWTLGETLPEEQRERFYRNVRASAESGWDFSSRWMRDPRDLRTLETVEIAPIDLNSLLYDAERTIAALLAFRGEGGDAARARHYAALAEARRRTLLAAAWDPDSAFFYDIRWRTLERVTDRPSLAAAFPLYFGLATPEQGRAVAARLERDFLAPGGFVTTRIESGQQWDAPNGWAPLQWLAIEGLRRYGACDAAEIALERWLDLNRRTFRGTRRMMEKYDVVDLDRVAGGGEYPTQDGFGWTNGVALRLLAVAHATEREQEPSCING